jgi:hypothetical protein
VPTEDAAALELARTLDALGQSAAADAVRRGLEDVRRWRRARRNDEGS